MDNASEKNPKEIDIWLKKIQEEVYLFFKSFDSIVS